MLWVVNMYRQLMHIFIDRYIHIYKHSVLFLHNIAAKKCSRKRQTKSFSNLFKGRVLQPTCGVYCGLPTKVGVGVGSVVPFSAALARCLCWQSVTR